MSGLFALITLALMATAVSSTGKAAPEKALAKHLLETYEELGIEGRPVHDVDDTIKVKVGLNLVKILKVKEDEIKISALIQLRWNDPFLDWDPKEHGDVEQIALPADEIWTPDISVWNDLHQSASDQEEDMEDADTLVMQDGTVYWIPRLIYKVSCEDDEKVAGQQQCDLIVGSWVHDSKKIDLEFVDGKADIDRTMFDETDGVELVATSATRDEKEFECCPGVKYTRITFSITVKTDDHCDEDEGHCHDH